MIICFIQYMEYVDNKELNFQSKKILKCLILWHIALDGHSH